MLKECKDCKKEISKKAKKCPNCGLDQRKFFMRHKIFTFLIGVIFLIFINSIFSDTSSVKTNSQPINIAEYKGQCKSVDYKTLARESEKYVSQKVMYTAKIIQVQESGRNTVIRANVTKNKYGTYDDTIWVNYQFKADEKRMLEDDIVNIYGDVKGRKTYQAILGNQVTIPEIDAKIIELVKIK